MKKTKILKSFLYALSVSITAYLLLSLFYSSWTWYKPNVISNIIALGFITIILFSYDYYGRVKMKEVSKKIYKYMLKVVCKLVYILLHITLFPLSLLLSLIAIPAILLTYLVVYIFTNIKISSQDIYESCFYIAAYCLYLLDKFKNYINNKL